MIRQYTAWIFLAFATITCFAQEKLPRSPMPENTDQHLEWFCLKGAVAEVREYDYSGWSKTIWRFDPQGRLIEYLDYGNPYSGSGGCVFGLLDHYRYAYDENGKIIFLETFNADNNVVDEYADVILELFPPKCNDADLFDKAEKEFGDTTSCFSLWKDDNDVQHYYGHRFDRYGNWIESVSTVVDDHVCAGVRVREITYYRDIEVMGLPVGVKSVNNSNKADGKTWSNRYDFDREGNLLHFRSWCDKEPLYEWDRNTSDEPGSNLIVWDPVGDKGRKITYWK